jgi:hypothetical protein
VTCSHLILLSSSLPVDASYAFASVIALFNLANVSAEGELVNSSDLRVGSLGVMMRFDHLFKKTPVLCQRMNCDCPFHRAAKNPARIRNKATFCKDEYALEAVMNADEACIQSNSFSARQRVPAAQHFVA